MSLLSLSLDEFRMSQLSESGLPYDSIIAGAAIFFIHAELSPVTYSTEKKTVIDDTEKEIIPS